MHFQALIGLVLISMSTLLCSSLVKNFDKKLSISGQHLKKNSSMEHAAGHEWKDRNDDEPYELQNPVEESNIDDNRRFKRAEEAGHNHAPDANASGIAEVTLVQPWNIDSPHALKSSQFLSYVQTFDRECAKGIGKSVAISLLQPTPEAHGEVHVNVKYDGNFRGLAVQAVSFDGFPLGRFPTPDSQLAAQQCSVDVKATQNLQSSTRILYDSPTVEATNAKPQVLQLVFKRTTNEAHVLWVYSQVEVKQIIKGFQIQVFLIPERATCYILESGPVYTIPTTNIGSWPQKSPTPSGYNCHGGSVQALDNITNSFDFNPGYIKMVEEVPSIHQKIVARGDFCPKERLFEGDHKGPLPSSTQKKLGSFLRFEVYSLPPKIYGWFHFVFFTHNGDYKFKRILIRVVTKSGAIIGNYLRFEEVHCTDFKNRVHGEPDYLMNEPPSHELIAQPSVVEINFGKYVTNMSIFWTYKAIESIEVERGVQIQVYILDIARAKDDDPFAETGEYFSRQFSSIYSVPRFKRDFMPEDITGNSIFREIAMSLVIFGIPFPTGDTQPCVAENVSPVKGTGTVFKLAYDYKRSCDAVGLRPGKEAQSLWRLDRIIPIIIGYKPEAEIGSGGRGGNGLGGGGGNGDGGGNGGGGGKEDGNGGGGGKGDGNGLKGNVKIEDPTYLQYNTDDYLDYRKATFDEALNEAEVLTVSQEEFYDGCAESKVCIGWPSADCLKTKDCVLALSFRRKNDHCRFEVLGQTNKYIAIGLSRDQLMGKDSVMECVREESLRIRVYVSYNAPVKDRNRPRQNYRIRRQSDSISILKGWYKDDWLYCVFQRKAVVTSRNDTFDLRKEEFYILGAHGDGATQGSRGGAISKHNRGSYSTSTKYALMKDLGKSDSEVIGESMHAITLSIAWLFCFPVSTFMVRYFKETYSNRRLFGMSVWFGAHSLLMGIVVVSTIASLIHVGITRVKLTGGYFDNTKDNGWYFHNIAGLTLVGIMLVQGYLGIFIVRKNKQGQGYRHLHIIHGFLGHSLFFLSYTILYKTVDMELGFPCEAGTLLITWMVLYFVIHLMMSYQVCYQDFIHGLSVSRVYSSLPLLAPTNPVQPEAEAPGASARRFLLGVFIFMCFSATVIIIVMYFIWSYCSDTSKEGHHHNGHDDEEDE